VRIGALLAHLRELETRLGAELREAAERHRDDHDVYHQCHTFAISADKRAEKLDPRTSAQDGAGSWTTAVGDGSDDMLVELRALYLRTQEASVTWTMLVQAAKASRDQELLTLATECQREPELQAKWFMTRLKTAAPQALVAQ
jgi:hypothetical protein